MLTDSSRVSGGEGSAGLAERAAVPVLHRGTGAAEGRDRARRVRRLLPGRPGRPAVRQGPPEAEATGQRAVRDPRRARVRRRLRRRRRRRVRRADRGGQTRAAAVGRGQTVLGRAAALHRRS